MIKWPPTHTPRSTASFCIYHGRLRSAHWGNCVNGTRECSVVFRQLPMILESFQKVEKRKAQAYLRQDPIQWQTCLPQIGSRIIFEDKPSAQSKKSTKILGRAGAQWKWWWRQHAKSPLTEPSAPLTTRRWLRPVSCLAVIPKWLICAQRLNKNLRGEH